VSHGFLSSFRLSQKVNIVLISGLMLFLAAAGIQQSRQQHALIKTLNASTGAVVNELATQMAADRAECESMMENAMADVVARFSPGLLAAGDVAGLQAYADMLARTPNVDEVAFLDETGKTLASASEPMAMPEAGGRTLGRFRMTVTDHFLRVSAEAGRHTAANAIAKSQRVAKKSLARADLTMTVTTLALAVLMAGLSTVLFRRLIGRPLGAIAAAMQNLACGQMNEVIPGAGRRDEIGDIAAASEVFKDSMIRAVQLAKTNRQLI